MSGSSDRPPRATRVFGYPSIRNAFFVLVVVVPLVVFADALDGKSIFSLVIVTLAGNWSPIATVSSETNAVTAAVGILLNVGALYALVQIFLSIARQERTNLVKTVSLFSLRDARVKDLIIRNVLQEFGMANDSERFDRLKQVVASAFKEGNKTWEDGTLQRVLGEKGAQTFLSAIKKDDVASQ